MKKPTCTLYIKCARFFFLFIPQRNAKKKKKKKKKKTGNSYNLIANHFHVKTASKFKFINSSESARNVFLLLLLLFCFLFLNEGLFDLPRSEKQNEELLIFERGVFWSCPGRNSRVVKAEKLGAFARHIPVLSLYGSILNPAPPPPSSPGHEFCNFRLENEFRTNFNPILTKC